MCSFVPLRVSIVSLSAFCEITVSGLVYELRIDFFVNSAKCWQTGVFVSF